MTVSILDISANHFVGLFLFCLFIYALVYQPSKSLYFDFKKQLL
jgi:hypothetical protein